MTSKERVLAAVDHRPTDRIPITFDAQAEVYEALHDHLGTTTKEELFDRLGCDTWMVLPKNYEFRESERGKTEKTSIWGYKVRVTPYSGGVYDEVIENPLAGKHELSDIDAHDWPDDDTLDFSHFADEIAAHQDRAIIAPATWGGYFIASYVRGMEDLMMDFAVRMEYAEKLIRTISERAVFFLDKMLTEAGEGIDIVYMADDFCSHRGPLFSPDVFRRLCVPYIRDVVDLAHRHDKIFLLHVCGAVRPLLPMIVDCGVDMLEPIQTRAAGMEPEGLKREFGDDLCFYGGMDLQQVLCKGTPDEVAAEVRHLIDVLGEGGGYVFGPGHTYIQIDAPVENIMTMYDTAAGYYPHS
ncbi:MAG: uroporphyrinogen decarboxylase family protein [Planctomycetota bacterium]